MGTYQDGSGDNQGEMIIMKSGTEYQAPALGRKRLVATTQQRNLNPGDLFGGYVVDVENHGMQLQKPPSAFLVVILAVQTVGQFQVDVSHVCMQS